MTTSPTEHSELERVAARYERLLEVQTLMAHVSRELGPALDLDHVLRTVLAAMRTLVDYDGGLVSLLHDHDLVAAAVDPPSDAPYIQKGRGHDIARRVLQTRESSRSTDVRVDETAPAELRHRAIQRGVASYLCVPLLCLGESIGVIQVYATRVGAFGDEEQVLLEGLATQVAGAIESARRYELISQLEVLKSDFVSRVSHELRTPITIMSGFVNTLLTNHDRIDSETRGRMLERVDVATARLSGLIDQLLMLSRLEAGVVAANAEVVDARAILESVRRESADPASVTVECVEGLLLTTDASLLVRALGILVDNAMKYAGACRIVATDGVIEIIDRGPGIPADQRAHVFERFTRANQDTTVAGMGIGLPMARTLLSSVGADLAWEEPADGVGTRMVVRFW